MSTTKVELQLRTHQPQGIKTIEASAGTGKTYTIKLLFLKLLVRLWQKQETIRLRQVLVVTFTEAATKELRFRIRETLQLFVEFLENKRDEKDDYDGLKPNFISIHFDSDVKKQEFTKWLKEELSNPDEASIFTIHGFCRTVLSEFPFECGLSGQFDITPNMAEEWEAWIYEQWRMLVRSDSNVSKFIQYKLKTPEEISKKFKSLIFSSVTLQHDASVTVRFEEAVNRTSQAKKVLIDQFSANDVHRLMNELFELSWISKSKYKRDTKSKLAKELVKQLFQQSFTSEVLEKSELATYSKACSAVNKNGEPTFSDELRTFLTRYEAFNEQLSIVEQLQQPVLACYLAQLHSSWSAFKKQKGLFGFDDLLLIVQQALRQNSSLVKQLREKYRFAFIDEFQDTDPVQFSIFEQIFIHDSHETEGFYMIGDPKQSIYSFRNADLNTYIYARKRSEELYHLQTNYRSLEQTVDSVNEFYTGELILESESYNPFIHPEIVFDRVKSSKKGRLISTDSVFEKPFVFVAESDLEEDKNAEDSERNALEKLVEVIRFYLNQGLKFQQEGETETRSVRPKDVAILVKTNKNADSVYRKLRKSGIPSVIYSKKSVYNTSEADYLAVLMQALLSATQLSAVKSALLTPFFDTTVQDIQRYNEQADELLAYQELFLNARNRWFKRGFSAALSLVFTEKNCLSHILTYADGERSVANVYHLIDLISRWEREGIRNPYKTLEFLKEKIRDAQEYEGNASDDELLRLESDDDKVKIVTIHSSKGLQYPIVIQPFAWKVRSAPVQSKDFEVASLSVKRKVDSEPEIIKFMQSVSLETLKQEFAEITIPSSYPIFQDELDASLINMKTNLEEEARQFYVALTRAEWQNVLIVPKHKPRSNSMSGMLESWAKCRSGEQVKFNGKKEVYSSSLTILQGIDRLAQKHPKLFGVTDSIPVVENEEMVKQVIRELEAPRERTKRLMPSFSTTSYSGIVKGLPHAEYVQADEKKEKPDDDKTFMDVKSGNEIGNVIHNVLEKIKSEEQEHINHLVKKEIELLGYEALFKNQEHIIQKWIHRIYTEPFLLPTQRYIALSQIPESKQRRELEFYLKSEPFQLQEMMHLIRDEVQTETVQFESGFIKGFMDLVFIHENRFYLLDYKSNKLGSKCEEYEPEALEQAMIANHYDVQMAVYTLALHEFLHQTIENYTYETHFGGMLYWFVRGLDSPGKGLYFKKLPYETVLQLQECIKKGALQ